MSPDKYYRWREYWESVCSTGRGPGKDRLESTHISLMKTLARMVLKMLLDYMVKEYLEMDTKREILGKFITIS